MQTAERAQQLKEWVNASNEIDMLKYEEEVMWGVAFDLDESRPPVALFATEEDARAYATLFNRAEWHVGPYVCTMRGRNDFDVPAPPRHTKAYQGGVS